MPPPRCVLPSDVGRVSVGHPTIFQYFSPFEHRKHIFSIIGGNVTGALMSDIFYYNNINLIFQRAINFALACVEFEFLFGPEVKVR